MNKPVTYTQIFLVSSLLIFASCKNETEPGVKEKDMFSEALENTGPDPVWKLESEVTTRVSHNFKQVKYTAKFLPALEFLARKGEKVAESDQKALEKESVILLELSSLKQAVGDVLKLEQCSRDYEKAIEYLSFEIEKDLHVEQGGQILKPTGIHFEREFNISSQKRVLCYFKNIDLKQEFRLVLNDRLLGAGILKYKFENISYLEKQAL